MPVPAGVDSGLLVEGGILHVPLDVGWSQLLVELVGLEGQDRLAPVLEIAAGGKSDRAPVDTAQLGCGDVEVSRFVERHVPLIRRFERRGLEWLPGQQIRRCGRRQTLSGMIQRLEAPRRILFQVVADQDVEGGLAVWKPGAEDVAPVRPHRLGRPVQTVLALPTGVGALLGAGIHHDVAQQLLVGIPAGGAADLVDRVPPEGLAVGADHRTPFFRLLHAPLQIADLDDVLVIQKELSLPRRRLQGPRPRLLVHGNPPFRFCASAPFAPGHRSPRCPQGRPNRSAMVNRGTRPPTASPAILRPVRKP